MRSGSLPAPPAEEPKLTLYRNSTSASIKPIQPVRRNSKRAYSSAATIRQHRHRAAHATGMDGRNKRVKKACGQCRMKKSKGDTGFPCRQCKDRGLICMGGVPKTSKYKQLPKGYAEVLENTQSILVMTIRKLYFKFKAQQIEHMPLKEPMKDEDSSMWNRTERASPSKLYHSNIEHDYQEAAFSYINTIALSPQNSISSAGLNFLSLPPVVDSSTLLPSPAMSNFAAWPMAKPQPTDLNLTFQQRNGMMANMNFLNQGHVEFEVDIIKPDDLLHTSPEALGMDDSMLYSGYTG
ncbi:hypothetical protein FOFC_18793 [Fusarium oxysporum]|nr:hypothetical protein FOFC_18793 [Fusarium oxysporum]